jgi:hypothetical protein
MRVSAGRGPSGLLAVVGSHLRQMRESQNTQSPGLRFRALMAEDGELRVQLHSV